jgi:shikimate kinase
VNIYLVGFMGTGKTSVAKILAGRLKMQFVEMDSEIEKREDKPITRIFSEEGEDYFRKAEKETTAEISKKDNLVVSCGGGVVLDEDNIEKLKKTGIVICLWAGPNTIYERVKEKKHRPLLNVENPKKRIEELLEARRPFYEKSDYSIDTSNLSLEEAANKIIKIIENRQ